MLKLSKEQADWLIERLCSEITYQLNNVPSHQIKEIINQCTEKEFPGFTVIDRYNKEISTSFAPVYQHILLCKIDLEVGEEWILSIEQFKQFTDGCQKVVEWLKEQECKS